MFSGYLWAVGEGEGMGWEGEGRDKEWGRDDDVLGRDKEGEGK